MTHLTTAALVSRVRRRLARKGSRISKAGDSFLIEEREGGTKEHDLVGLVMLARAMGLMKENESLGRDIK